MLFRAAVFEKNFVLIFLELKIKLGQFKLEFSYEMYLASQDMDITFYERD